ncbi:MAG: membrane protein insertase YidC [Spirochaetota bacterium]
MDKNTIIAIAVIFFLVMIFQFLFLRPKLEEAYRPEAAVTTEEKAESEKGAETERLPEALSAVTEGVSPVEPALEKLVSVETQHYNIQISTAGASVLSFRLKDYVDQDGKPIELIHHEGEDILPFEVHFDRLKNVANGDRAIYHFHKESDNVLTFFRDFVDNNGNPFRFKKTYIFTNDEFMFELRISVQPLVENGDLYINRDNVAYTLVWGPELGPVSVVRSRYNVTMQGYHENRKFHKVLRGAGGCSLRRMEARYIEISRVVDWVGITNRYFLVGIVPDHKNYIFSFDQRTQGKYFLGISGTYHRGRGFEDTFKVYTGPKERKILKRYGYNFDSVMSGRLLKPVVLFLEWMIHSFYRLTGNYGIAIILMTIAIKIILHPLTYKSFQSMRRMSALQPKINEIRERYKNNPQQMNREMQALYRKEKVNPMGGCLPMLLQLPIFYGLYTALSNMIELRNQAFLWIRDLSLPDTVATLKTSIPLLGYRIENQGYTDINILPFIMTATTLLQSRLTSGDQSNQQSRMMTYLFPIIFFFIFWNMPSGLVLYWTIQNVLTIAQQYMIDYRFKKKGIAPAVPVKSVKSKKR